MSSDLTRGRSPDVVPASGKLSAGQVELSGPAVDVLMALVDLYERTGRATVRSVAMRCGKGIMTTHQHLRNLRSRRLVEWEPGTRGTLRPCVNRTAVRSTIAAGPGVAQTTRRTLTTTDLQRGRHDG